MEPFTPVVQQYQQMADFARGESDCFTEWALGVTGDAEVQAWIASLPQVKQQPNLVFAAARWHGVPAPAPYAALREALLADGPDAGPIRATILERSTQTNEVGRLATLVPVFAGLSAEHGPLALVEAGASAGLCLYPDRYDYLWSAHDGAHELTGSGGPVLTCAAHGPVPYPDAHPTVAFRGGLDLHPLDVTDEDQTAWLSNLVWPEQDDRLARLAEAIAVARAEPPTLVTGDLLRDLPPLLEEAGRHGMPVLFHSAVVAYLEPDDREVFHELMVGLVADGACRWVSNEGPRVLPRITAAGPAMPPELTRFVLGVDGRAVAWTHGHGTDLRWLG